MWDVEGTDQFAEWFATLTEGEREHVATAILQLQEKGPTLRRPFVDTIKGSRL